MSVTGENVEVNGARMASGATLFPGDVVRLGEASTAALQFGGRSAALAAPLTELVIETVGVTLRSGRLQVRTSREEPFQVSGLLFHVNVLAPTGAPAAAEIQVGAQRVQISAVAGNAEVTVAGNATPYRLHAGETATLDATGGDAAAGQDGASPAAGKVSRLVPQVQIDRASQHLVASVSDSVYWNDDLRSGPAGRAHVALKDGSQLNLGSNSSLRILQHDAQAQQTSLDLVIGRLRGKITKLTRPGAKFEIRTPVGVAGLVGTDLSLLVTDDYVELIVFEGAVRFSAFSSGRSVTVTAGMKLRISRAGVFDGPSSAAPGEIQTAKDLTDISGPPVQTAAAGSQNGPLVPVAVSVSAGAVVTGIGVWLDIRERQTVSPTAPGGTTTGGTGPPSTTAF